MKLYEKFTSLLHSMVIISGKTSLKMLVFLVRGWGADVDDA